MQSPNSQSGPSKPMVAASSSGAGPSVAAAGKPDRLYVGNLSPTVDEYTLLQIFQKFGKVTKLDFMFHKTGVQKGKPRGYAFIEFADKDDALKAMVKLHDRLLRGRKLVVTSANSAPLSDLPLPAKGRRYAEQPKTTTLSLLKSKRHSQSTTAQIAAMEAKLAAMSQTKPQDEDYVPGSSAFPLGALSSARASPSGSASPAGVREYDSPGREVGSPDRYYVPSPRSRLATDNVLDEQQSGNATPLEDIKKAAEDLERQFRAEIDAQPPTTPTTGDIVNPHLPSISSQPQQAPIATKPKSMPDLPAKPVAAAIPLTPAELRQVARDQTFRKGLAGLPKRPAF